MMRQLKFIWTLAPPAAIAFFWACSAIESASAQSASTESRWSDAQAKKFFNDAGCNGCHATDETRIGPSYRSIAMRYAGEPVAEANRLTLKIQRGGGGAWGWVPMVSNPRLSSEQTRDAVTWILQLPEQAPTAPNIDGS